MVNMVPIATFGSHVEAELAKSALRAGGVDVWITADDAGQQNPGLDYSQGVAVLVRAEDADRARAILAGPGDA
jgi:hypothetical protein